MYNIFILKDCRPATRSRLLQKAHIANGSCVVLFVVVGIIPGNSSSMGNGSLAISNYVHDSLFKATSAPTWDISIYFHHIHGPSYPNLLSGNHAK